MRFLTLLLVLFLVPAFGFARGMDGGMERMRIGGFYGYGGLTAQNVNDYITATNTANGITPPLNTLNNASSFGAEFGYMVSPRFEVMLGYDQQWAKNPVNTNNITNAGIELSMNAAWGGLNYWFLDHGAVHIAIGGLVGYPTQAHASLIQATRTEYDSAFAPLYQGVVTALIPLGKFLSIGVEGGYQFAMLNVLSSGTTANNLTNPTTGANVNMDMTGWRAKAGLNFHF